MSEIPKLIGQKDTSRALELIANDVNQRFYKENTPLTLASLVGDRVLVQELLKRGADANLQSDDGATALINAVENNNTEVAWMLIPVSDVNLRMTEGTTAFGKVV